MWNRRRRAKELECDAEIERMAKMREFLELLHHDIATPMLSVDILTESLLSGGQISSKTRNEVYLIQHFLERVNSILEIQGFVLQGSYPFSESIEERVLRHRSSSLERVPTMLESAKMMVVISHDHSRIKFSTTYARNLAVLCDRREVTQALISIIDNSCRAVARVNGTINLNCLTISQPEDVGAKRLVQIIISDDGCGITPHDLPQIYHEGFTTRVGTGHGYGLSLAKKLILANGGTIQHHSEGEMKGTTVILTFPLAGSTNFHV